MPQKSKIVITKKVKITREYVAGEISREEAARRAKVAPASIARWARIYRFYNALRVQRSILTPLEKDNLYFAA